MVRTAKNPTAHTITQISTERIPYNNGFDTFLRAANKAFHLIFTYLVMVLNRIRWLINRPLFHVFLLKFFATKPNYKETSLLKVVKPIDQPEAPTLVISLSLIRGTIPQTQLDLMLPRLLCMQAERTNESSRN